MQARSNPQCRLVVADPIHSVHDLNPLRCAPAGDEGTRDRHVNEIDGERIVDDTTDARGSDRPCIRATIGIEPSNDLIEPTAQAFQAGRRS